MSEQLRDQLPIPDMWRETGARYDQRGGNLSEALDPILANAKPNVATQDYPQIAYDVAHAIKPDIDAVVDLRAQRASHEPIVLVQTSAGNQLAFRKFPKESELTGARYGLEKNAVEATKIAASQHLGESALAFIESKQQVANAKVNGRRVNR